MEITASLKLFIVVTIEAESFHEGTRKFGSLYPKIEFENKGKEGGIKIISHNCDNIEPNWEVQSYYKGWD
jgi:hypothetical protein